MNFSEHSLSNLRMEKLKKIFTEMLHNVGKDFSEKELTAQFPIKGNKYKGDLMVVGRALNRWGCEKDNIWWNQKNGKPSKDIIDNIINYSLYGDKEGDCPMKWITDHWGWGTEVNKKAPEKKQYNMKYSAFWRVIKEILSELKITSSEEEKKNWPSYLVWTNLYKVASPKGRNPSTKLCNAQFDKCKTILKEEIEFYKPNRILFLTGHNWFCEFEFENIGFKEIKRLHSLVEWVGSFYKTKIVVAKHPQGKNESEYIKQLIKYFH